jgi:phosphate butyryltransferase
MMQSFEDVLDAAKGAGPARLAIPFVEPNLDLICRAAVDGFIVPCLVGDGKSIGKLVEQSCLASVHYEIIDEDDPGRILHRAIAMVREKQADVLMQCGIDQNVFLNAALDPQAGLLKSKDASYVSVFELPDPGSLILVTDTYLNNYPNIAQKQRILENAILFSAILGIDTPKVSVLAAIEQVNPGIPSTVDAAVLSKMSERGQFGKAMVEGPLDIDCSLSSIAARRKGLHSPVTGNVDIYLVPEIDTGQLLAEALVCIGRMPVAGMVVGTACPMILDVPFVPDEHRLVEIALASLALGMGEADG